MTNTPTSPTSPVYVNCPKCGDPARLYGIEPHVRLPRTEIHTFVCDICDATEVLIVPLPKQMRAAPQPALQ